MDCPYLNKIYIVICVQSVPEPNHANKKRLNAYKIVPEELSRSSLIAFFLHFIYFIDGLIQNINWKATFMTKESTTPVYSCMPNPSTWSVRSLSSRASMSLQVSADAQAGLKLHWSS